MTADRSRAPWPVPSFSDRRAISGAGAARAAGGGAGRSIGGATRLPATTHLVGAVGAAAWARLRDEHRRDDPFGEDGDADHPDVVGAARARGVGPRKRREGEGRDLGVGLSSTR